MPPWIQMESELLRLISPGWDLHPQFLEMVEEFHGAGELDWPHGAHRGEAALAEDDLALSDFGRYLEVVSDMERGNNLHGGIVPCSTYWFVHGSKLLGTASFRHVLNERLLTEGGQIGYCIRPSERNMGHATELLQLVLAEAPRRGLERVLILCRAENLASARVIEKCGGQLWDEQVSARSGKRFRRYWIEIGP